MALALAAWLWSVDPQSASGAGAAIGAAAAHRWCCWPGFMASSLLHAVSATPQPSAATANAGEPFTPSKLASLRACGTPGVRGRDRGLVHHLPGQ